MEFVTSPEAGSMSTVMFGHHRRWHGLRNECIYKPHTHLLVLSKASFITVNPSGVSSQAFTSAESQARGRRTTGPRVIPSARIRLLAPPPSYAEDVTEVHVNPENTLFVPKGVPNCPQIPSPLADLGHILKQANLEMPTYTYCSAASISAGHKTAFCCCHRHLVFFSVQAQRSCHSNRDGHVSNHILTTSSHHLKGKVRHRVKITIANTQPVIHNSLQTEPFIFQHFLCTLCKYLKVVKSLSNNYKKQKKYVEFLGPIIISRIQDYSGRTKQLFSKIMCIRKTCQEKAKNCKL